MEIDYQFVGWCYDSQANHDKVWVSIRLSGDAWSGNYLTVWGRRGKKLQSKTYHSVSAWEMSRLYNKKTNKDYQEVSVARLGEVYPEFQEDLEKSAVWSLLAG